MAIVFDKVFLEYNKNVVLNDMSFSIDDNKITGIYGKNGSGKSTIANIISNSIIVNRGYVTSMGVNLKSKNSKYKKRIGYSHQYMGDWFGYTVYDEVSFILKNNKYSREKIDYKLNELLQIFGLGKDFLDKKILSLNNGEKRIVSIMDAVCCNPDLIILDEPTIGLDCNFRKKVISFIKSLKNDYKKTVIVISSDIDLLIKFVDDLIVIDNGKLICSGKKMDVISNVELFKNNNIELPSIIDFSEIVKEKKNKKIGYYDDIKDLMKAVYRNV